MNGWRNISCWHKQKKIVAIFNTNRADFKTRKVIRDKEGHYIKIKGPVLHDNNPYHVSAFKIHKTKTGRTAKGNRYVYYLGGGFNTPSSEMDRARKSVTI